MRDERVVFFAAEKRRVDCLKRLPVSEDSDERAWDDVSVGDAISGFALCSSATPPPLRDRAVDAP